MLTDSTSSFFFYRSPANPTTEPAAYPEVGLVIAGTNVYLPTGVQNLYGLPILAVKGNGEVDAGGTALPLAPFNGFYYWDVETALPSLGTVDYYFTSLLPAPGTPGFSPTNTPPILVAGLGQSIGLMAWAKQSISNGYSGKFAYLEQFFDQAYVINTNGVVTTNSAGSLTTDGIFVPTNVGPAAILTMPDVNTGQRGTGVVYVVSLNVDANHDGVMDLTLNGPDNASPVNPMVAWVNNGLVIPGSGGNLDHDVQVSTNVSPNYAAGKITCQRDLESFFRLWVCGVPSLPASQGYSATLSLPDPSYYYYGDYQGNPVINLYAAETNGGTGYLTDTNIAQSLVGETELGTISPGNPYTFPANFFTNGVNKHFLFEGAGIGNGQLTLTIWQGTNAIAQSSVYVDLHDIKDLYEQAHITNVIQTWPEMVQQTNVSGFQVDNYLPNNPSQANQLAVFVHGWRMTQFDYEDFSDTMFKRLYWQGYQGGFASLRWPTRSLDTDTNLLFGYVPAVNFTYNRCEHIAFESGTGTAAYFNNLRQRFTNDTISVCSHSMGGIVMMEALKELATANQSPLDNYVLMQAAVPAHCYDTTITNVPFFAGEEGLVPTPNIYSNYAAGIDNALRGKAINFYNPLDYALQQAWVLNEGFYISSSPGPLTMKPNTFFGYSYNASSGIAQVTTNSWQPMLGVTNVQTRIVTDPLELMPFVARPRSLAVGAQGGVGNTVNGGQLDLTTFGFGNEDYDHSGEFNRNIQTSQVQGFYTNLVINLFPSFH